MLNSSQLAHSLLTEELDHDSSLFHELALANDDNLIHGSLHAAVYDTALFDVLKVDPEDFASQITLMDLPVFQLITPDELLSCSWSSKSKLKKAFHIVQFTRRFNQVNFWTQGELLRADILKHRTEILAHFIRIAKKLFELNNINASMAVAMALQSAPIYRLEKTWLGLSKRDRTSFAHLKDLFSSNENWKRLREHLSHTKLPCIPYLGIYLTDIVRIDTLHPHHGGLESTQRRNSLNNICRMISEFQQSNYHFLKSIDCVQSYLSSVRYMEELQTFIEDQNYKRSLLIESDDQLDSPTEKLSKSFSLDSSSSSHRRSSSDHTSALAKSATLPSRTSERKNLLDDSDLMTEESESSEDIKDFAKQKESLHISDESKADSQCFIERRCLLKAYKKPNLSPWRKYWITIVEHYLFFHRPKSIFSTLSLRLHAENEALGSERSLYREDPSKCQSIRDWLIVLSQGKNGNEIQLSDLNRGSMYKFKFESCALANLWFERLKEAAKFKQRPAENLIALD